jgi:hypothetical protein
LVTYYLSGKEIPFANKDELQKQIPIIRKKFLYAADFAKSGLKEIFTGEKLKSASLLSADYFASSVLINDGNLNFSVAPLPWQAQLTPYKDAVVVDANGDALPDVLLFGNFYENHIQLGRSDGDFGTLLINEGRGKFRCENLNGLVVKGQVRRVKKINIGRTEAFVLARNNDSAMVVKLNTAALAKITFQLVNGVVKFCHPFCCILLEQPVGYKRLKRNRRRHQLKV